MREYTCKLVFNIASNLFQWWIKREKEKERERERSVHSIPIKKSTIKKRREEKTREGKKKKKKTADGSIVFTYLYCLWCMIYHYHRRSSNNTRSVHLRHFWKNQVSISFYLYNIIYINTQSFIVVESFSKI